MRIPPETIEQVRQASDIVEVVNDFVSLKKRGSNYIACCPFHNEKTPSFSVNPARQIYKCFGCGKAGDPIRFVMDIENIGYGEAIRYLAKKYGIEIEEKEQTPEELIQQNERESLLIVLNFAKTYFQELLLKSEEGQSIGLSYFRERGFSAGVVEQFELGYSLELWDGLLTEAKKRGYSETVLEKAGLILRKENPDESRQPIRLFDRFRGRVMFPIHNVSGRVIAFGARILKADKNQPKYLNSPETPVYHKSQVLYGIFQAKKAIRQEDVCFLTEGYTDVISLHQAGIENVVASSGTSLTPEQIKLISRFTTNVTILYDGDAAGIKAALRGLDMVLEEGLNLRLLLLPDGEDPDSYVHKVGAENFKTYIRQHSQDFIDFKAGLWLAEAGDDPLKRAEGISDICASITRIPDALKRQTLSQRVAQRFQVAEQAVITEINRLLRLHQQQKQKEAARPTRIATEPDELAAVDAVLTELNIEKTAAPTAKPESVPARSALSYQEEECVRLLINYGRVELEPDITLCQYMLGELGDIVFQTPTYNVILQQFREAYQQGTILTGTHFLNQSQHPELQQQAIHLTTQRYEISDGWRKHEILIPEEQNDLKLLSDLAFFNLLRIKKILAQQRITYVQQALRNPNLSVEEIDGLLKEHKLAKEAEIGFSQMLGIVISG